MGNCFGRCLTSGRNNLRHSTDEQEADELVQEDERKKDNFIFKIIKFKKKKNRPQFIDNFWEQKESQYKRLNLQEGPIESSEIQLQCLDANNLLKSSPAATTSLDIPLMVSSKMKFNQNYYPLEQNQESQSHHHENCNKNQIFNTNDSVGGVCCGGGGGVVAGVGISNINHNINSSRASSSLDLEWEHEYGNNIQRQINTIDSDEIKNLTQSWYFIPSEDDEFLTSTKIKKHNISNQQLINISNDDDDDDDDDDDVDNNHEYAIDVVNCKDKNLFIYNNSLTNNLLENHQNTYYIKNLNKSVTSTPSPIGTTNNYINLQKQYNNHKNNQQQQQQQQQQNTIFVRTPSRTSWSHISTPESLEWDIDEEQQKQMRLEDDNLDHETLELLHEIELLKNKVLNETGGGLIDDKFEMNWKDNSS